MTEVETWQYLVDLDARLLKGSVILSEWATFLIRDADTAYAAGANFASIITGLAAIETHLSGENWRRDKRLVELIDESDFDDDLKNELHALRRFRNGWVHIADPREDDSPLESPEKHEAELEEMARRCAIALRRTVYRNPWI